MKRNIGYKDLSAQEAYDMEYIMCKEIEQLDINHPIRLIFQEALYDYKFKMWKYDGPTFSKAPYGFWEVAAFVHDWRNSMGYVGYDIDEEMFSIMIVLNYPIEFISQRWLLTRLTFFNIFVKWITRKLKNSKQTNLFLL